MDIKTSSKGLDHIKKLEELKKKEPTAVSDELLRQHIRKLQVAWNPMPLAAVKVA